MTDDTISVKTDVMVSLLSFLRSQRAQLNEVLNALDFPTESNIIGVPTSQVFAERSNLKIAHSDDEVDNFRNSLNKHEAARTGNISVTPQKIDRRRLRKGKRLSEAHRQAIKAGIRERKRTMTDEHREKIRSGVKKYHQSKKTVEASAS